VVFIGVVATRAVQGWLENRYLPRTSLDTGLKASIRTAVGYVGVIVAGMIGLSSIGLNLENLALVAGALSVGIGFGLQSIVSNFVSGLILLAERPFKQGDWIVVGEEQGIVKRINVRATELQTFDRATVLIPNSDFIAGTVKNRVHRDTLGRIDVPVGVGYDSDPEKVKEILLEVANAHPMTLSYPEPAVFFVEFGASSLDFMLFAYLADVGNGYAVRSDIRFEIFRRFKEEGIEIPFAQSDVTIRNLDQVMELLAKAGLVAPEGLGAGGLSPDEGEQADRCFSTVPAPESSASRWSARCRTAVRTNGRSGWKMATPSDDTDPEDGPPDGVDGMLAPRLTTYDEARSPLPGTCPRRLNMGVQILDAPAALQSDAPAIIDGVTGEVATFGALADEAARLSGALQALGARRGDRVAVIAPQGASTLVVQAAILRSGLISVPLSERYGREALAHRMRDSGARFAFVSRPARRALPVLPVTCRTLVHTIALEPIWMGAQGSYDDLLADTGVAVPPADTGRDDPCLMIYTSGTTGPAKGALHGHRVLAGHMPGFLFAHGGSVSVEDVFYTPADWAWAGGLLNLLFPACRLAHRWFRFPMPRVRSGAGRGDDGRARCDACFPAADGAETDAGQRLR
jgi:small-conductance mechanosensitive channel